jgi:hypothetical protein
MIDQIVSHYRIGAKLGGGTPMGRYTGVKEMIEMSETPGEYKYPLTPLGSWQPSWL